MSTEEAKSYGDPLTNGERYGILKRNSREDVIGDPPEWRNRQTPGT
jgi:hypothetical protein